MVRARSGVPVTRGRKRTRKLTKGFRASRHNLYRQSKVTLIRGRVYAFRDRRVKKRQFRRLWIVRINAACRMRGMRYSELIHGLQLAMVALDRKSLSEIAIHDPGTFTKLARVARENGWSRTHADGVGAEYKRSVFRCVTSDEPVCPSEDGDVAWHLHLTYTRSYWKRFCGDVLGRPLHHDPTKGGPAEADKHLAMDDRTRAAYREAFGERPPAGIWPAAGERFGDDLRHRGVNTARNRGIPKA